MISRSSPVPIYHQLMLILRRELQAGRFHAGDRYHSDTELKAQFDLSHLTVRQALRPLVAEGLIQRQRGSGTFVTNRIDAFRDQTPAEAVLFSGWTLSSLSSWEAAYFRDIYEGIDTEVARCGFRLVLDHPGFLKAHTGSDAGQDLGLVGAIVLQGSKAQRRAREFARRGLKVVTVNFQIDGLPAVAPDHAAGGRLAISHLLALGHRRIAHLNTGEHTEHWVAVKRAFVDAVAAAGLTPSAAPVIEGQGGGGTIDLGYALTTKLWKRPVKPTAIFSGNDLMAIGTLRFLYQQGIRVPDEVSVIGFDNIQATEICTPALTTVGVDRIGMGRQAVQMLLSRTPEHQLRDLQQAMPVKLVTRESIAAPPRT